MLMRFLKYVAVYAAGILLLGMLSLAIAAEGDRHILAQNAVLVLSNAPCAINAIKDEPGLKGGKVIFSKDDGRAPRNLCWIESKGVIGVVDSEGATGLFPSDVAVKPDAPRKGVSF